MSDFLLDQVRAYADIFPDEAQMVERSLDLLKKADGDVCVRATTPAHITASLLIVSEADMLTIWHPYLKCWIQPGGHIDPGEVPIEAALREASEETGLTCDLDRWHAEHSDLPYDIDCLFVPANPKKGEGEHWHIDFRYLMVPRSDFPQHPPELETRYIALADLGPLSPSLSRLCVKLMPRIAAVSK